MIIAIVIGLLAFKTFDAGFDLLVWNAEQKSIKKRKEKLAKLAQEMKA